MAVHRLTRVLVDHEDRLPLDQRESDFLVLVALVET